MTKEEKEEILNYVKILDQNLDTLKKYQNSLAICSYDPDKQIGEKIKAIADEINALLDLLQ